MRYSCHHHSEGSTEALRFSTHLHIWGTQQALFPEYLIE